MSLTVQYLHPLSEPRALPIDQHSAAKPMELEQIKVKELTAAPPLLPWKVFCAWIGMGSETETVRGWIRQGYLPTRRVGKYLMVNVALLNKQLLEEEDF